MKLQTTNYKLQTSPFSLIAAVDKNYGIGKNNQIPWRLSTDLKYFHQVTLGTGNNAVIMGRNTWESLPNKFKPLPNRLNIVISRNKEYVLPEGVILASSLDEALEIAKQKDKKEAFVIGGAQIFKEAVEHVDCTKIYLTEIDSAFDCDTFFPKFDTGKFKNVSASEMHEENGLHFCFVVYSKD